jgi:phosphoserine phosphatase
MEYYRYRGYQIEPRREWSNWCVSIYPTRSDLPILSHSTLQSLTPQKDEALADAKQRIDHILSDRDGWPG